MLPSSKHTAEKLILGRKKIHKIKKKILLKHRKVHVFSYPDECPYHNYENDSNTTLRNLKETKFVMSAEAGGASFGFVWAGNDLNFPSSILA